MPNLPISSLPELAASALTINAEFAVAQSGNYMYSDYFVLNKMF